VEYAAGSQVVRCNEGLAGKVGGGDAQAVVRAAVAVHADVGGTDIAVHIAISSEGFDRGDSPYDAVLDIAVAAVASENFFGLVGGNSPGCCYLAGGIGDEPGGGVALNAAGHGFKILGHPGGISESGVARLCPLMANCGVCGIAYMAVSTDCPGCHIGGRVHAAGDVVVMGGAGHPANDRRIVKVVAVGAEIGTGIVIVEIQSGRRPGKAIRIVRGVTVDTGSIRIVYGCMAETAGGGAGRCVMWAGFEIGSN